MNNINGFVVLPIQLGALKTAKIDLHDHLNDIETEPIPVEHFLYLKKHSSKKDDFPKDRTLFVLNCPVDATKDHFQRLFRRCGIVENVVIKDAKSGYNCHVVFEDEESVDACLSMKPRQRIWMTETPQIIGLPLYLMQHVKRVPPKDKLKEQIDSAMIQFDEMQERERKEQELKRNMPDEDGFITVTRGKRVQRDGDVAVQALSKQEAQQLKPKENKLVDFYRFQMRESKRNGITINDRTCAIETTL
ncbi:ribosomal RNA-processing protein 7-domain-containing protein [Gorgonomyces haynaldii]|nr:ribosomal RNA-processing protein 7-domain-containing protein [Gorgonomyces haynaldii]